MACSSTAGKLIVLTRCLQESMFNNGKKRDDPVMSRFFCMSSKNSLVPSQPLVHVHHELCFFPTPSPPPHYIAFLTSKLYQLLTMCQYVTEIYTLCDHYDRVAELCLTRLQTEWHCRETPEVIRPYELLCVGCQGEADEKAEADKKAKRLSTRVVTKVKEIMEDATVKRGVKEIKWQKNPKKWAGPAPKEGSYEGRWRTVSKFEK